jgi:hypothetical protein
MEMALDGFMSPVWSVVESTFLAGDAVSIEVGDSRVPLMFALPASGNETARDDDLGCGTACAGIAVSGITSNQPG